VVNVEEYINVYKELMKALEERLNHYREGVKRLDEAWIGYRNAVNELKREWDSDYPLIESRVNQLKAGIEGLRRQVEEAEVKREIGLMDDESYGKLVNELNTAIEELSKMYDQAKSLLGELENGLMNHWIRSIDVSAISQEAVEKLTKNLEEAKANGQISEETYARLKRDLDLLAKALQAYSLLLKGQ
jgi:predicted  nucleic acid-binding Zn-ribbon protein